MGICNSIGKLIYKFSLYLPNNEKKNDHTFEAGGVRIGDNVRIYGASSIVIDETRTWLLRIGNNVRITHGVQILTHDYSKSVLETKFGENIGEGAETIIGNNVFIGMGSILLMGSHVGNNVIIGAGSVVHGKIPDDVVVAGNPARVICTIKEHLQKRRMRTADEALLVARSYVNCFGKKPTEYDMRYFRELFGGKAKSEKKWSSFESFLEDL